MPKHIASLKKWLAIPGNTTLHLALKLNYKSPGTIDNWIRRKNIPSHKLPEVLQIIDGVKKNASK